MQSKKWNNDKILDSVAATVSSLDDRLTRAGIFAFEVRTIWIRKFMEAFQLLSRGGAVFNKKRFTNDVQLFNVSLP